VIACEGILSKKRGGGCDGTRSFFTKGKHSGEGGGEELKKEKNFHVAYYPGSWKSQLQAPFYTMAGSEQGAGPAGVGKSVLRWGGTV